MSEVEPHWPLRKTKVLLSPSTWNLKWFAIVTSWPCFPVLKHQVQGIAWKNSLLGGFKRNKMRVPILDKKVAQKHCKSIFKGYRVKRINTIKSYNELVTLWRHYGISFSRPSCRCILHIIPGGDICQVHPQEQTIAVWFPMSWGGKMFWMFLIICLMNI